jgi:hypothetical protein
MKIISDVEMKSFQFADDEESGLLKKCRIGSKGSKDCSSIFLYIA